MKIRLKKQKQQHEGWYHLLPLVFIIGIVPLIVRSVYIPLEGIAKQYWPYPYDLDLYCYWKAVWLEVVSTSLIFIIYIYRKKIDIKESFYLIPISVYTFFVVLSSLTSEYKYIAFFGFPGRYEGMFVILAYLLIAISTIFLVNTEKHVSILMGTFIASATIIGIIGALQYFGYDFMKSDFIVKRFIVPAMYYRMGKVEVNVETLGISSTLYNSNFVGSYMAMAFPLSIVFLSLFKRKYLKILMIFFGFLMLTNLVASRSRAGYIGSIVALLLIVIMLRKYIFKYYIYFFMAIFSSILYLFLINSVGINNFIGQFFTLRDEIYNYLYINKDGRRIKDIVMSENKVTIVTRDNPITFFTDENNELRFNDRVGNEIIQRKEKKDGYVIINFDNNLYNDYEFSLKQPNDTLHVQKSGYSFSFKLTSKGIRFVDIAGRLQEIKPVEKVNIAGSEESGSGRLFIWSRTLPLLKKTMLTGFGPGTFAIYFPQTDFVGKLLWKRQETIVEKPHNLYLDIGVSTGVVSLIGFIALIGIYFVSSLKLYMNNNFQSFYSIVGGGLFPAIVGYLIAGFFNDSAVPVAPVFWILFGLGICMNRMLTKRADIQPKVRTFGTLVQKK